MLPELGGEALEPRVFDSTYLDTADHRLARNGVTLRHRVEDGTGLWQLKLPQGDARLELEAAGGPGTLPDELRSLVVAYVRGAELVPIATLRTRREGVLADGAEVVRDTVAVLDHQRVARRFEELEVELVGGDEEDLQRIEEALRRAGATDGESRPEGLPGARPRRPVRARDAPEGASRRQALRAALRAQAELLAHDPGTRLGSDPEELHQLRVATRRLRAYLRAGSELLRPRVGGGGAGRARLARRVARAGARPRRDARAARVQRSALGDDRRERPRARRASSSGSGTARRNGCSTRWSATATWRCSTRSRRPVPAARRRRRRSRRSGAPSTRGSRRRSRRSATTRRTRTCTRLRIKVKRSRYAAELAGARRLRQGGKALQDVLGEHQDAVVAEERLRGFATRMPARALAAGRLVEREQRERRPQARRVAVPGSGWRRRRRPRRGRRGRRGRDGPRAAARAPAALRRLDVPEGQGGAGRERRGLRAARGGGGDRAALRARPRAADHGVHGRPGPPEARPLVADGGGRGRSSGRQTRWTRCAGWPGGGRARSSRTAAIALCSTRSRPLRRGGPRAGARHLRGGRRGRRERLPEQARDLLEDERAGEERAGAGGPDPERAPPTRPPAGSQAARRCARARRTPYSWPTSVRRHARCRPSRARSAAAAGRAGEPAAHRVARSIDLSGVGGSPCREERSAAASRGRPSGPTRTEELRADDDLGRAAADVADRDHALAGMRARDGAREGEAALVLGGEDPHGAAGSAAERVEQALGASPWRPGAVTTVSSSRHRACGRSGVPPVTSRTSSSLLAADASVAQDLRAEPEVRPLLAHAADVVAGHDATSRRAVFEPTSMTPTRMPVILASTPVGPPACSRAAGTSRRRAQPRAPLQVELMAVRALALAALPPRPGPSAASSHADALSAKALSKIATSSWRAAAARPGTTISIRWSRLRGIRSALPR